MFDSLVDAISGSGWAYGIVFLFAFLDAVFPVVPSETAVITAGVLAANGDLAIELIIVLAALGAILGDNLAYTIGRSLKTFVKERLFRGSKRRHLDRAERALKERGGSLIVIGRFIPGGRTAVTFASGVLRYPWPRFIAFDVAAGFLWATYSGLIGYFGGKAFEDDPLKGILLALGIALGIAGIIEGIRWRKRRALREQEDGS
jgi:membrane protein DedA with SNARE-associated domain